MTILDIAVVFFILLFGYIYIQSGKRYLLGTIWHPQEITLPDGKRFFVFKMKYKDKETKLPRESWMVAPLSLAYGPRDFREGDEISVKLAQYEETMKGPSPKIAGRENIIEGMTYRKVTEVIKPSDFF